MIWDKAVVARCMMSLASWVCQCFVRILSAHAYARSVALMILGILYTFVGFYSVILCVHLLYAVRVVVFDEIA